MTYLDELFDLLYDGTDADWDDKIDGCLHSDSEILSDTSTEIAKLRGLLTWAYEHGICDPGCCGDDCLCDEIREVVG